MMERRCVLLPNADEFDRLYTLALEETPHDKAISIEQQVYHLSQLLGGVTIVRKGKLAWHCFV